MVLHEAHNARMFDPCCVFCYIHNPDLTMKNKVFLACILVFIIFVNEYFMIQEFAEWAGNIVDSGGVVFY